MSTLMLLATHAKDDPDTPLAEPVVIATLTTDKRFLGHINPMQQLHILANKCGLLQYAITDSEEVKAPGYQLPLFVHVAEQR